MNPRSSTETFASSIGRILPFRKTMCASLLEPQPECIPGPPENPGDSHRLESDDGVFADRDRKSTRLNSSHSQISYAVFCLKKKKHICNAKYLSGRGWGQSARCPPGLRVWLRVSSRDLADLLGIRLPPARSRPPHDWRPG